MQNQWDFYSMVGFAPETHVPEELERLSIDPDETALFLDFDGTLVDIAETPDSIIISDSDRALLNQLNGRHNDAVSIVSGRNLSDLELYLGDFKGTVSGGHGAELRHLAEKLPCIECDLERLDHIRNAAREFALIHPPVFAEEKSYGIVLHFRQNPDLEAKVREFLSSLVHGDDDFELQFAKMAIEIKPKGVSKAQVIERIMSFEEFNGRKVLFAGDDETDEAAFDWVNKHDGISIKIGEGPTRACYRTHCPAAFKEWLRAQLDTNGA